MKDIRNCFAHGNGFVRKQDGEEGEKEKRQFCWKVFEFFLIGKESGQRCELKPDQPIREVSDLCGKITEKSKSFNIGDLLAFSPVETYEIALSLRQIAIYYLTWNIETVEVFAKWWNSLNEAEQIDVDAHIMLLEEYGPNLPRPYSDILKNSKHANMKELRIQHKGKPYRIIYAFDPRRTAILLLGGNKDGDKRWYKKHIPIADKLFNEHLKKLRGE